MTLDNYNVLYLMILKSLVLDATVLQFKAVGTAFEVHILIPINDDGAGVACYKPVKCVN